ncbi:MAG: phosphocholine cytidylyltransferase family protein [Candidatus Latescibacteria bacterium]|nr:phosphocholine cytidylyltransferase family protein [Candidatus Latescibacterota bacterium]
MRPIILGAGRGSRLKALTDEQPKCYAPVAGRRLLDWVLEALTQAGLERPVFVGGYRLEQVRADYPQLEFCHNPRWQSTNILESLLCAEAQMGEGFVCSYADILYRPGVVRRALEHPGDRVLCVDTEWRSRYADRSQHPEHDAEKVQAQGDRVAQIDRGLAAETAAGEYIGVAKFSATAAAQLRAHYHRVRQDRAGQVWKDGKPFEQAYLIHLFAEMLAHGLPFHLVTTEGEYMEIDTEEDYALAQARWGGAGQ